MTIGHSGLMFLSLKKRIDHMLMNESLSKNQDVCFMSLLKNLGNSKVDPECKNQRGCSVSHFLNVTFNQRQIAT